MKKGRQGKDMQAKELWAVDRMDEKDRKREFEGIIYDSLRQDTIPDEEAIKNLRSKYGQLSQEELAEMVKKAKARIDNEKKEFSSYLEIEKEELGKGLSGLEGMLKAEITAETANSIRSYESKVSESYNKYCHFESDALLSGLWEEYLGFIDDIHSRTAGIKEDAAKSVNLSLESLLLKYNSVKILPENISQLREIKKEADEKKDILSRLGADQKLAVNISDNITGRIEHLQNTILKEKQQEQDLSQQREEAYSRFNEMRSQYYDGSSTGSKGQGLRNSMVKELSCLQSELYSLQDKRAEEVELFISAVSKDIDSNQKQRSRRMSTFFKRSAAALALGMLLYGGARVSCSGIRYISNSIESHESQDSGHSKTAAETATTRTHNNNDYNPAAGQADHDPAPARTIANYQQDEAAQPAVQPEKKETILDRIAAEFSGIDYIIYVDKSCNCTSLYEVSSGKLSGPLHSWTSIDGKGGQGPKTKEGDFKTPEGIYRIKAIEWIEDKKPLYGPVSIQLDYPNKIDKEAGRTGGGEGNSILICGTYMDDRLDALQNGSDITNGSVVLKPDDATQLANSIEDHINNTIVVIEGETRIDDSYLEAFR